MEPIQVQVINGKRIYKQAKVRRETPKSRKLTRFLVNCEIEDAIVFLTPGKAVYVKEPVRR